MIRHGLLAGAAMALGLVSHATAEEATKDKSSSTARPAAAAQGAPSAGAQSSSQSSSQASTRSQARALALSQKDPSLKWGACPPLFPKGCEIAMLQGDPAKPNADVFLRVPGGYAIPPHSHTSAEHMVLVSGEMQVHYQGQPATTLRTGDYAYGPPKLPHLATCRSQTPCTLFIAFEQPVDALPFEGKIQ